MPLIIPEAQTPFDPVSQPRVPFDTPNLGDGLKLAGDTGVAIATKRAEEERANQMREARVSTVERLGALRTQYEQDPNLIGLSDRFNADIEALGKELAEALPEGRMRRDFDQDFREVVAPQTQAISQREFALRRDAGRADLTGGMRSYAVAAGAAPDDASRDAILKSAAADVGAAAAAGWISEQEAEKILSGVMDDSVSAAAIRTLQEDPAGFLADAKAGKYPLPPGQLARLEGQAKSAITRQAALLDRQIKTEAAATAKQQQLDVDGAIKILEAGGAYDGLPELFERISGTEEEARLTATLAAVGTEQNFTILSHSQQLAALKSIDAAPTSDPKDIARRKRLHAIAAQTKKSIQSDILTHVADRSILSVDPVDMSNPASVTQRIAVAEAAIIDFGTSPQDLRYFTNGERDTLQASIEGGDVDAQMAVAVSIVEGFGDRAPAALLEIGAKDPVFALAGHLISDSGDITVARTMLTGRQMLRDKSGAKPGNPARGSARTKFAGIYPPGMTGRMTTLLDSADAHYAASALHLDSAASVADKSAAYENSVQQILGQTFRGNTPLGGVQRVNGVRTLLPSNMTAEFVEDAILHATPDQLLAASASGGAPMWGGQTIGEARELTLKISGNFIRPTVEVGGPLGEARLVSIGGGQYLVGITRENGEVRYLQDEATTDGWFRLNLETLVGVGPQERGR